MARGIIVHNKEDCEGLDIYPENGSKGRLSKVDARMLFWAIALAGLSLRLGVVWFGWADAGLVADDAYYYFVVAGNFVRTGVPSFDGLHATNGFHPLWMLAVAPFFGHLAESAWSPIRCSLSLAAVFDLLTAIVIYTLPGSLPRSSRLLAVGFWCLSPYTALLSLRGMESSLSTLLVLVALSALSRTVDGRWSHRNALVLGTIIGLAGLARTDNLASLAPVALWSVLIRPASRPTLERVRFGVTALLVALLWVFPWFLWNAATFGTFEQVSGRIKFATPTLYGALPSGMDSLSGVAKTVVAGSFPSLIYPTRFIAGEESDSGLVTAVGLLLLLGMLVPWMRRQSVHHWWRSVTGLESAALLYAVSHSLLFGVMTRFYVNWYGLPTMGIVGILVGAGLGPLTRSRIRSAVLIQLLVWAVLYASFFSQVAARFHETEPCWPGVLEQVYETFPDGATAGAFNAGRVGYLALKYDNIVVVNLDGLVNNEAAISIFEKRYLNYILTHVDVLLESPSLARMHLTADEVEVLEGAYEKGPGQLAWFRVAPDPARSESEDTSYRRRRTFPDAVDAPPCEHRKR